jgi:PAS domain S-box-containing protein
MSKKPSAPSEHRATPDWHLAAVVESSDDAIVTKSLEGIITSWNPAAEKIFGYTAQEVIGKPISIIIPADRGDEEPQILAKIRRGERIHHFETVRVRKDGQRIDVSLTISPVKDSHGRIIGASKIARDISDRKLAERQIRLERDRLQTTLSSIGDAVMVTDARGVVEFMNPTAERLTGWSQQEAQGKPLETVFSIVNETSRTRVENPVVRAIAQGAIVGLANHTLLLSRDGSELAIDDSAAPIRDGNGGVAGVILVFRDVTAARTVADFRARLSAIVENSDDAIVGKDLDGRITSWNKGAEKIFGYSPQEAIGRPITMIIPPDRLGEETEILKRLRRGERVDHFETIRLAKDQRQVEVSLTISPILDAEGRVIGASKIARDITEKKRSEKELKRAHEQLLQYSVGLEKAVADRTAELRESLAELEVFSSSLSHDMKAPLRAICGYAQALHDEFVDEMPPEAQDLTRRLLHNCGRLTRFLENVLSYARLRNSPVALETVELDQVVRQVLEDHPHATHARAEVDIQFPLGWVIGNEALLTQVIANLISNAVKFVAPATTPKLKIWSESADEKLRLNFQDNGIGIAPADRESVFGLFKRLDSGSGYEGSGVGLAVVQRALNHMGGAVGLESEVGTGSRFWIELKRSNGQV